MKQIFLLITICILNIKQGVAQTAFEVTLLKSLNEYRKIKGLAIVYYDSSASVIAKQHSTYLNKCSDANHIVHYDSDGGHDEKYDVPDFTERTLEQRANSVKGATFIGEICYQTFEVLEGTDEKSVAANIIKGFDASPGHKNVMTFDYGNTINFLKPIVGLSVLKKLSNISGYVRYVVVIDFGFVQIH